ncbi:MAG: FAD-dependent oxidoreductase, partial [Rhodobacterales bacterium]
MSEHLAAKLWDLAQNTPVEVDIGARKVLLVRDGDHVHALAATCPHRGVPLSKGAVAAGRLICPAHRAIFDLASGEVMAPPACENLARYDVRIADGEVHVRLPDNAEEHPLPAMARKGDDPRRFVIIGSGAAGWRAAETLRREGFAGEVLVLSDEPHGPLDRIDLSKAYLKGDDPDTPLVRSDEARKSLDIELRQGEAASIDTVNHEVVMAHSHERIGYDRLLIATGSDARRLDVEGTGLAGIHLLRRLKDADSLRSDLAAQLAKGPCRVAIIGGGFIGLEVATVLSGKDNVKVTVILNEARPLERQFGRDFAARIQSEHEDAGVRFVTSARVCGFAGGSRVSQVNLNDGDPVEADLVLVAVGAVPRTAWLPFHVQEDGGIHVADDLSVPEHPHVFLAGDIARIPTLWGPQRIEHWRFAQETGELAARNMLGQGRHYESTPYFWTMQQAKGSYSYTGHALEWDSIRGAPEGSKFAMEFVHDGKTEAVLALGFDDAVTLVERRMAG